MHRRNYTFLLVAVLAWLGTSLCSAQNADLGRLYQQLRDGDWQIRRTAAEELGSVAPEDRYSVEALIGALDDSDSRVRRATADALAQIGPAASRATASLIERLADEDPQVVLASTRALGSIGRRASRAARDVRPLLQTADAETRLAAADSLARMGRNVDDAIPALVRLLDNPDTEIKAEAARSLGRIGQRADGTARELMGVLGNDDAAVRAAAAAALGEIGEPVVPGLISSFNNGNPVYLEAVVEALGNVGPVAVPDLITALEDERRPLLVRQYAAIALARIGAPSARVVPALAERLGDDNPQMRIAAAEALGNLGPVAENATGRLIETIENRDEDDLVREYAIAAAARVAPSAEEVSATLVEAVADSNASISQAAVAALLDIGFSESGSIAGEVAGLIEELSASSSARRLNAAQRLAELGPYARDAVDALTQILGNEQNDSALRQAVLVALGEIGPAAEAALPTIIPTTRSPEPELRSAALIALRRIGPQTRSIPALMQALKSSDLGVRGSAATAIRNFALARLAGWQALLAQSDAPVLRTWLSRHQALYGVTAQSLDDLPGRRSTLARTDYFDVLGGRAAIRESVQLQSLTPRPATGDDERTIPIEELAGVTVRSHPFEDMLEESGRAPGRLTLAEYAPADAFFAYFAGLSALRGFLEGGTDLLLRLESSFATKSLEYDVGERYLARLGLNGAALATIDDMNAVDELALVAPDLFFLEGTDVTAIIRPSSEALGNQALRLIGLADADDAGIRMRELASGQQVFGASRPGLIFVSTSGSELRRVLDNYDNPKRESLGRSAEFQYMLQRLPIGATTQSYFYLSDPFIRHLVSPATKIAQLRRMQARAELDTLTAGAMLFKLDGNSAAATKARLLELGYVPEVFSERDYSIGEDFIARSPTYGRSAALAPLSANPVVLVSENEADAYREYAADYARYWSEFFDPIALRLDRTDERTMELTTLVLPLLDSAIYDQVSDALAHSDSGLELNVPELDPPPFLRFSVNLSDSMRLQLSGLLADVLADFTTVSPQIFDELTPTIHVAIWDSSPIVAVGSGDILGAFSEDLLRLQGFEPFLPILLSLVTQPASIFIEVADAERVLAFLRDAVSTGGSGSSGSLHQVQGEDKWIYTVDLFGLVQLQLLVSVENEFLVISNLPWSAKSTLTGTAGDPLNGARLELDFDAISELLSALHTKAYSDYRKSAIDGMGYLFPLLASGVAETVSEAQDEHLALFGFKPLHPASGRWLWQDGALSSSIFGTVTNPVQPPFREGDRDFGLFPGLESFRLSMQLEDAGLRAAVRWRLGPIDEAAEAQ